MKHTSVLAKLALPDLLLVRIPLTATVGGPSSGIEKVRCYGSCDRLTIYGESVNTDTLLDMDVQTHWGRISMARSQWTQLAVSTSP